MDFHDQTTARKLKVQGREKKGLKIGRKKRTSLDGRFNEKENMIKMVNSSVDAFVKVKLTKQRYYNRDRTHLKQKTSRWLSSVAIMCIIIKCEML